MTELNIALVHLDVKHGRPDENLAEILRLCRQAADQGAKIVAGPEMSLSGYSFASREEIAPFVQSADGPAGAALAELARERHIYIVAAWAESDPLTGIFYNSAFVFGPDGTLVKRYRKVNGESRWACPGPAVQDNVFDTPWGRMGLLICADSYHSLMPRVTALKGADLIFVPATWPSLGLSTSRMWRMRALENGCFLVAVNRTGQDQNMDCRSARSYLATPGGEIWLDQQSDETALMMVKLPLDDQGRLAGLRRSEIMSSRRPSSYYRVLGNFSGINDLTGFLKLPPPGLLDIHCLVPESGQNPLDCFQKHTRLISPGSLVLLPQHQYSDQDLESLRRLALSAGVAVVATRRADGPTCFWKGTEERQWQLPDESGLHEGFPRVDWGPARIMIAPLQDLWHPELALSAAKWGCDLAVCSEHSLNEDQIDLVALRPIEQIALAACAKNGAAIGLIPQGHQAPRGARAAQGDRCSYDLDTHETRHKRFQDRIDFETLFARSDGVLTRNAFIPASIEK